MPTISSRHCPSVLCLLHILPRTLSLTLPVKLSNHHSVPVLKRFSVDLSPPIQQSGESIPADVHIRIRRPPNPFIIFRCEFASDAKRTVQVLQQTTVSQQAGAIWKRMSPFQRLPYVVRAEAERREHASKHPNYRHTGRGKGNKTGALKAKLVRFEIFGLSRTRSNAVAIT